MKDAIKQHLEQPEQLEKLYRTNKIQFRKAFDAAYPDIQQHPVAQAWQARLHHDQQETSWGTPRERWLVVLLSIIAGLIAKYPDFSGLEPDYYYQRNIAFVVFPALAAYFAWKQLLPVRKLLLPAIATVLAAVYINLLPANDKSDTLLLASIHLPLFMWTVLGYTFTGRQFRDYAKRIDFLRYNGDLVVMTTVMLIAGGILSAVTIGLFDLIGIKAEEFYFRNIAVWGLAAAPLIGTFLVQTNPQLVKYVSPVIARIFAPLVLVMLLVYLSAMVYTGKDPYNDREFLLIFNLLLVGVMAIILFSVAETTRHAAGKANTLLLLALAIVTIFVNGIALSAILFRISEWGITPNRLAVLGSNLLILVHLLMVSFHIFQSLKDNQETGRVEKSIAWFLPVYSLWTMLVVFGFPQFFSFQ